MRNQTRGRKPPAQQNRNKMKSNKPWLAVLAATPALVVWGAASAANPPISFSEIGQRATADYHGDALAVTATADGAHLRCGFQKLEGRATAEGLWLESTAAGGGKLRLVAQAVDNMRLAVGPWKVPQLPVYEYQ